MFYKNLTCSIEETNIIHILKIQFSFKYYLILIFIINVALYLEKKSFLPYQFSLNF